MRLFAAVFKRETIDKRFLEMFRVSKKIDVSLILLLQEKAPVIGGRKVEVESPYLAIVL